MQNRPIAEIFTDSSLSLYGISELLGDENYFAVRALLNIIIDDTVSFFNVGKNMTGQQVIQTVDLIVKNYKHLKPADFKKCFENAKGGMYGKLYDRLDGQIILDSWLAVYDLERDGEIEALRAKQNRGFKVESSLPMIPKLSDLKLDAEKDLLFKQNMEKLQQSLSANKAAREEKKADPVSNPIVDIHQKWINQFDAIWEKQKYPKNRMITRYGMVKNPFYFDGNSAGHTKTIKRQLDVNAFLEHKQWQYKLSRIPHNKRQAEYLKKR